MTNNIQTYQITCWIYWIALSNEQGNTVEQLRYTAWGVRVNPYTWKPLAPNTTHILDRGYTMHEHLDGFDLINMNGRIYDPVLCRFLSPDNYVQNTTDPQNFNKYSYALNNPLKYTDPSGEAIFTILSAIFCPALLPIAIQTDIGWISGGIRGAGTNDMSFWDGAWRGAITGAVGGTLSMVGGGPFVANVAWGMLEGAITGGLDAALWGNDIGPGMLYGAAIGGVFAAGTSGIEAYGNYRKGYGFRTDEGVINYYRKSKNMEKLSDFFQNKYGIDASLEYHPEITQMDEYADNFGLADCENNRILLTDNALKSNNSLKATIIHEQSHLNLDSYIDNIEFEKFSDKIFKGDGYNGYYNELRNAGRMHINPSKVYNLNSNLASKFRNQFSKLTGNSWYLYRIPSRFRKKTSVY